MQPTGTGLTENLVDRISVTVERSSGEWCSGPGKDWRRGTSSTVHSPVLRLCKRRENLFLFERPEILWCRDDKEDIMNTVRWTIKLIDIQSREHGLIFQNHLVFGRIGPSMVLSTWSFLFSTLFFTPSPHLLPFFIFQVVIASCR